MSLAALMMAAALAGSPEADTKLFPAHFPITDPLYEQLDAPIAGPEGETEAAEAMKQMLIQFFDMKPIHVDDSTHDKPLDGQKKQKKQKHGKTVGNDLGGLGWDFAKSQVNANNVGTSEESTIQVALSWAAPLYLDTVDRFTLLSANPKFIFEILGSVSFTLHLNFIEFTFTVNMNPFKFTPFDILLRTDALHLNRRCSGFDYKVRTLVTDLMIETRVNECFYGLIGRVTGNDESDCTWRTYKPELPLYRFEFDDIGDVDGTYVNYSCQNWYSATWDNWPLTEEYIDIHRSIQ